MDPLHERLGRVVRRLRQARDWSQEDLEDEVHLHRTFIGNLERGNSDISVGNLQKLAQVFGMRAWELLRQAENEST